MLNSSGLQPQHHRSHIALNGMSQEEGTGGPGQTTCPVSINQEHGGRHSVIEAVGAGWFL